MYCQYGLRSKGLQQFDGAFRKLAGQPAAHNERPYNLVIAQKRYDSLSPTVDETPYGSRYAAGAIEMLCGDAFALDAQGLSACAGVYDRAALIALPPPMRERYVHELHARLPSGCRGLLVTLDYPQDEKQGPPFSVDADEVHHLYGRDWDIELLERRDILAAQPGFVAEGVSALHTAAWRIHRR